MEKNTAHINGALLIAKAEGVTSHTVISQLRKIPLLHEVRIGHSGTLDPFASGLLIALLGHATRLQEELHLLPKTYQAEITLGATSDTDDKTGVITPYANPKIPTYEEVFSALAHIRTQTEQIPPSYAAIKISGKKMYEYAREGKSVLKKSRPIMIYDAVLESYEYPRIRISITCSTGTYIRSIARDIGELLNTGAYCSSLTRTTIGPFTQEKARAIQETPTDIAKALVPIESLVSHIPYIICNDENVAKYKQGKQGTCPPNVIANTPIALLDTNKRLFGIARCDTTSTTLQPKKIFL